MTTMLVTYDLHPPVQDYDKILDVIKKYDYAKLCRSSYVVSIENVEIFLKEINSTIDESTELYLFTLSQSLCFDFGASDETKKWLESHSLK